MIKIARLKFKTIFRVNVLSLEGLDVIMLESIRLICRYMWKTKKWWMVPALLLLVIIGLLIILSTATPVPIFIYPLI